jgi:hypothetical protein
MTKSACARDGGDCGRGTGCGRATRRTLVVGPASRRAVLSGRSFWPRCLAWTIGQVAGLAVDSRDHVWIIQRPWSVQDDGRRRIRRPRVRRHRR